jgi:hypothetical protein
MTTFPLMPYAIPYDILRSISLFASATSTGETINMPAGVRDGDFVVLVDSLAVGDTAVVTPTGFTRSYSLGITGGWARNHIVSTRLVESSSEANGVLTGGVGSSNTRKILLVFRGNVKINTVRKMHSAGTITNGNPAAVTLISGGRKAPLLVYGVAHAQSSATIPFSSTSPAFGDQIFIDSLRIGYTTYSLGSSPSNQTFDINDLGNANGIAGDVWEFE